MRLSAIGGVLPVYPSLREIPGAEDDNRPEALLAAVCAVLFFTLLCGNCIAFLIGFKYPELVARIYPILLLIIILLVSSILTYKLKISAVNAFDEEELTEKEKKQLKHVGLKSGLCFGISMFLGMPLVHFLVDNKDYLTELFSIRNMLSGIFEAIFFGAIMQGLVNAGIKQAKSQAEKDDQ